jgi:hypothetical protein
VARVDRWPDEGSEGFEFPLSFAALGKSVFKA